MSESRRFDGQPETAADTKFFDLRESGYTGWIDQDGNATTEREFLDRFERDKAAARRSLFGLTSD